ncbi:MAG: DUF1614 domain-containing protein [Planctomycetaceae bacterium]|nr:DUF1614 domain-containing protein [Planctomycetaceae bacterium]
MSWGSPHRMTRVLPAVGCLGLFLAMLLICLMPLIMFDVMQTALARLHLSPMAAGWLVVGIFLGSVVNIPLYRFTREDPQPEVTLGPLGYLTLGPQTRGLRMETVVAINLGGCIIPCLIGLRQFSYLWPVGAPVLWPLAGVCAANIAACYLVARPVAGVGIMMPGLISPLVAVLAARLLCPPEVVEHRVAIAYLGGILGPVVGADLLHLKDILKVPVGVLSIGGAGTFDGIVLSGILAALLA